MKNKRFLVTFMVLFALTMMLGISVKAEAASFKTISPYPANWDVNSRTVNGCKFEYTSAGVLTATKGGQTKSLSSSASGNIITDGTTIYYMTSGSVCKIYTVKYNGTGRKLLRSFSTDSGSSLEAYYNSKIYFVKNLDPGTLYSHDVKTAKLVRVRSNVTNVQQYGKYLYLTPYAGAMVPNVPLVVYNASTGTAKTITKNLAGFGLINGKLFYAEYQTFDYSGKNVLRVKTCSLSGSSTSKKTLASGIKGKYIIEFGTSKVKYMDYNNNPKIRSYV